MTNEAAQDLVELFVDLIKAIIDERDLDSYDTIDKVFRVKAKLVARLETIPDA